MRRGTLWLPLLLAGTVVAGACTDMPSAPVSRDTMWAQLPASRITVPARSECSAKLGAGAAFGIGGPSFNYTIETAGPLTVDPTVEYDPWDPGEVPVAEYSGYYDAASGEPCWEQYMHCIGVANSSGGERIGRFATRPAWNGTRAVLREGGFRLHCGRAEP